jgi:hypothetical protein
MNIKVQEQHFDAVVHCMQSIDTVCIVYSFSFLGSRARDAPKAKSLFCFSILGQQLVCSFVCLVSNYSHRDTKKNLRFVLSAVLFVQQAAATMSRRSKRGGESNALMSGGLKCV